MPSPTPSSQPSPLSSPSPTSEVILETPQEGARLSSPIKIKGQAPGSWFFEGQIVAQLLDKNGKLMATSPLVAQGEWMTEKLVTFEGELSFTQPKVATSAALVIASDNPSGLPENQKTYTLSVELE